MHRPAPVFLALLAATAIAATTTSPAHAAASPWNGSWTLDAAQSSPGAADMAAPGYAFAVTPDGAITWRIPAIGEVATGRTDGTPMTVHRTKPRPGLALSVRADGPLAFRYQVLENGTAVGAGLMRLIEGGKAWVDISWRVDRPEDAGELVYVRSH